MKRILIGLLSAVLVIQMCMLPVFAEAPADETQTITISGIDALQLDGSGDQAGVQIKAEGMSPEDLEIVSEEVTPSDEYVISGEDIEILGGRYSYKLVIRANGTLTFDNDLEILYQGVNGKYRLHYEIDETDNHIMIVTGNFENIILASPLMKNLPPERREWILSHISDDSYFYELVLRTKEGFSFTNSLQLLVASRIRRGYSMDYQYDLASDEQTFMMTYINEEVKPEPVPEEQEEPVVNPKEANPLSVKGQTAVVSFKKLKKKNQVLKASKVIRTLKKGAGTVSYTRASGNKKIVINKKTGKVTVKKGLKKATYKVRVKVRAAGNSRYKAAEKSVTFRIKVK